jgi:phosphoribosylformylglycinamidine synthase PurS subunit
MHAEAKSRCAYESFLEVHRVKYVAYVNIKLKQSVLDPQGEAVRSALVSMGYGGVQEIRLGKRIRVELEAANEAECREIVDEIKENQ